MAGDIAIGLLGLGTVGTGVAQLIERNQATIRKRLGCGLSVAAAAVRDPRRKRGVSLGRGRITTDARRLIADPSIDIVVELIGGVEPAKSLVLGAMAAGKDVVTANKALLATHGQEVFEAAERASVRLGFEASVAGGIPIIRVLRQALAGDRNRAIYGIVNGTCNSILTAMTDRGAEFQEALAQAQAAGLAEADPSLDVDGTDAAQKLSLLVALAFGARCPLDHGRQIQVAVGDVQGQNAVGLQVAQISAKGLVRDQVDGDGVAGKGVDYQQIEPLIALPFERKTAVAQHQFDARRGIAQVGEFVLRDLDHQRVDLVDPHDVARHAICG